MQPALDLSALHQAATGAERHWQNCQLCAHRCGEKRATAQGRCHVGREAFIASEMLHVGEEELLRPAHAIFFSGCTATCTFCAAARFAFRPRYGITVTPAQLAQRVLHRQAEGARSLCFIGGDPAPHIPFILQTLAALGGQRTIPAVFNSNFYLTGEALALLAPAIDIYLPDLKFGPAVGPDSCGERIGGMPGYWPVVTRAIDAVRGAGRPVIVRHLLMPGHFACCTQPALTWLAARPDLQVSLLTQYQPMPGSRDELAGPLSAEEIENAQALARALGVWLVR